MFGIVVVIDPNLKMDPELTIAAPVCDRLIGNIVVGDNDVFAVEVPHDGVHDRDFRDNPLLVADRNPVADLEGPRKHEDKARQQRAKCLAGCQPDDNTKKASPNQ